jgi:tetratricopeptide (TPR) repeat protein
MGIDLGAAGWWAGRVAGSVAFVGREGELSRLRGALGGDTRLVLVVGDAGIGKTRFAAEGMRLAAAGGLVSVWGGCLPLADKLSLLPMAEALGELATLDSGSLLATALNMAPPYVRGEVGRLVPQLGSGELATGPRGEGWRRDRLFTAVAELLGAAARRSGLGVVIEDVHWADRETLDLLTFLVRAGRDSGVRVVVTCRSDEAPLDVHVIEWLAHVRSGGGVEEIRLGPLSREEAAEQIASVVGGPAPAQLVDDLYARAEGNPFFTEQLVAAALLSPGGFSGLPAGLAESLAVRAGRCGDDARTALAALAVAGRSLAEDLLVSVTGLSLEAGLRALAAARLLADTPADDGHRPRHALLAEAVAAGMLPGERAGLHARTAQALAAAGDQALAAEIAGHWAAAGRPAEELPARVAAAEAAEGVFGYAEAAGHWRRAIELCDAPPGTAAAAGIDVPRLYVRAIDALDLSGDGVSAGLVAEEAYRRFADHPDQPTAAVICHRAAAYRQIEAPAAALPLIEAALRLFEQAPPSADYAEALFDYARVFLPYAQKDHNASLTGLTRALDIAEAAGATPLIPRILSRLAHNAFVHGQIEEGLARCG